MIKKLFQIEISKERIFGLDLLRALAILFVVFHHGQLLLPKKFKIFEDIVVFDGVSIFFVLSGFLIGGILIKIIEKQKANKKVLFDFWIRRWFRTLPNYFLILITITIFFLITKENFQFSNLKYYYIFSQNLFSEHPIYFPEAWSLSIEEWFYLIIPTVIFILIALFKFTPRKSVLFSVLTIILLVTLFRIYRYAIVDINSYNDWNRIFRKQVITRLDSLMFGVVGAYIQYYKPIKWIKFKLPFLFFGMFLFVITKFIELFNLIAVESLYTCVFSFTVTSIATLMLLPYLSHMNISKKGSFYKIVTVISLTSYSMYLLNLTVVQGIIIKSIPWNTITTNPSIIMVLKYSFFWIVTILGSILIYKYYEIPLTKLRDSKWFKKK